MNDKDRLEQELQDELIFCTEQVKKKIHYRATRFSQMLANHGAVETARKLIHSTKIATGFWELVSAGYPELTVEYTVLKPKYRSLFTDDELQICRRKLQDFGVKDIP